MRKLPSKHRADHHRNPRSIPTVLGIPSLSECSIGSLKQHELEGVRRSNLLRWHLVTPPVVGKILDESAQAARCVPGSWPGLVKHPGCVPAFERNRSDRGLARIEQCLKRPAVSCSRNNTTSPHYRNWLGHRCSRLRRWNYRRLRQILSDRHVHIQATDPKGVHRRLPRPAVGPPGPGLLHPGNAKRSGFPVKLIVEVSGRTAGGNVAVFNGQHNLHQTRQSGRLQRMPDVCLDAANRQLSARR